MAKAIVVDREGAVSSFDFSKVSRTKLYGKRQRMALDPSGRRCTRAALTADGSLLLRAGMTAQGYFDGDGTWVPNKELVGLDEDGGVLESLPSTLGNAQTLVGPVPPQELLDLRVAAVYALEPTDVDAALQADLDAGQIFRFPFVYRGGHTAQTGFLVANDEGAFAIVGAQTTPEWCTLDAVLPPDFEDDDAFADDLDFEMF